MLLAMLTGYQKDLSVYDLGLAVKTQADGLAVGKASRRVWQRLRHLVSGIYTVSDKELLRYLHQLYHLEKIPIEPSAAAGFAGPHYLCGTPEGRQFLSRFNLTGDLQQAHHIVWSTGGSLVPAHEFVQWEEKGRRLKGAS
jgi:D-serine dehydratase